MSILLLFMGVVFALLAWYLPAPQNTKTVLIVLAVLCFVGAVGGFWYGPGIVRW